MPGVLNILFMFPNTRISLHSNLKEMTLVYLLSDYNAIKKLYLSGIDEMFYNHIYKCVCIFS